MWPLTATAPGQASGTSRPFDDCESQPGTLCPRAEPSREASTSTSPSCKRKLRDVNLGILGKSFVKGVLKHLAR